MADVNELVICKDNYNSQEDFEGAVRDSVMLLLNAGYIMTVRYDDPGLGIICIEYDYADKELGGSYPYWLSYEEFESIVWHDE